MKMIVLKDDFRRLLRDRRRMGGDRYDEVWNGVYVMSPIADNEHQGLGTNLVYAFKSALPESPDLFVFQGTNVSDRTEDWRKNYRCPDVAVFLPGNPAEDRGSHWLGGPDFAIEILSRGDRSRKKFDFYKNVGVRELLLVSRRPWRLELYRSEGDDWTLVGTSSSTASEVLASDVLSMTFRLVSGEPRPTIEVARADRTRTWTC